MKIEDIKNVAVFFNMNGKTVALRMDAEQKRIVALMALNTADARAELIEVPHMTLPADPAMEEAANEQHRQTWITGSSGEGDERPVGC
ncbi:hypothetical protein [Escherichia coli]|uniref:hypothetical protein n=1 Tax=Escherichia coli TaxID=562 RepID=UPI002023383D|nr:hypothetical protein [Escherichia coli]